jgi:hypothetical protein
MFENSADCTQYVLERKEILVPIQTYTYGLKNFFTQVLIGEFY